MVLGIAGAALLSGCPAAQQGTGSGGAPAVPSTGSNGPAPSTGSASAGNGSAGQQVLTFWHTRRGEQEKLLQAICDEYSRVNPSVKIVPEYQGNYGDLGKKVRAAIQAKRLPALAVAYESNVTEYAKADVIRPLDGLVEDPKVGLTAKELADIPEAYLTANRYRQLRGQLLSFPFTKSNLMLYYNKSLLQKAGFSKPPETWAEFERQTAAVTQSQGKPALAFTSDASTLDGMIYSFGGNVISNDQSYTLFDQQPTLKMFGLLQRLAKSKNLVELSGDDATGLFQSGQCAFMLSSSSSRASAEREIGSDFDWDLAVIPHAEGVSPVTVMYGPNICIFRSNALAEAEAWKFVRYFVSPEVTARWARETGYLPIRRSAVELPEMKRFYQEHPRARHVYEALKVARGEPNALGWQEVRDNLEQAASSVIGGTSPATAAVELRKKSDRALTESR
jgi:multiple sugar transport system substrate-binding protein